MTADEGEQAEAAEKRRPQGVVRQALSLEQRRELRQWANSHAEKPSHKACIQWFERQYGHRVSQSTISHSLSAKYARLDTDTNVISGNRLRFGNWPDVEKIVLLWYQDALGHGRQPSNEEMAEKAKAVYADLPRYHDTAAGAPEFSPGWIHRFKKRYGLLARRNRRGVSQQPHQQQQQQQQQQQHPPAVDRAVDVAYLVEALPRVLNVLPSTKLATVQDFITRCLGLNASLKTCGLVRDEILRRATSSQATTPNPTLANTIAHKDTPCPPAVAAPHSHHPAAAGDRYDYHHVDAEDTVVLLRNALGGLQHAEENEHEHVTMNAAAQAAVAAAAVNDANIDKSLQPGGGITPEQSAASFAQQAAVGALATSAKADADSYVARDESPSPSVGSQQPHSTSRFVRDVNLTPIRSSVVQGSSDQPLRCPFCVNTRLLRTIHDAVEHLSTHVIV